MSRMFGGMDMGHMFPKEETLVLNRGNSLIRSLLKLKDREEHKEDVKLICQQVYDLAMLSHKQLDAESMTRFIERSNKLLERLATVEE